MFHVISGPGSFQDGPLIDAKQGTESCTAHTAITEKALDDCVSGTRTQLFAFFSSGRVSVTVIFSLPTPVASDRQGSSTVRISRSQDELRDAEDLQIAVCFGCQFPA